MKYAVVDLESTGPRLDQGDRIIQIGAVIVSDGHVIEQKQSLVNPHQELSIRIQQLTGIRSEELKTAPDFSQIAQEWFARLADCVFVAHNLHHDLLFLKDHFAESGLNFDPPAIDSILLAKICFPQARAYNLIDLAADFHLIYNEAHQALADAQITCQLLDVMARKCQQLSEKCLEQVITISKSLDHQESYFFESACNFCLDQPLVEKRVYQKDSRETLSETILLWGQLLQEKLSNQAHLIVEGNLHAIDKKAQALIVEWFLNQGEKVVLVSSKINFWRERYRLSELSDQPSTTILLNPNDYIHPQRFKKVFASLKKRKMQTYQAVILAASCIWLEETQTGLLLELNHEIDIRRLMVEYETSNQLFAVNPFYQRAAKQAQKAQLVIMTDQSLFGLKQSKKIRSLLANRLLMIQDLDHLAQSAMIHFQRTFNLSHFLVLGLQLKELLFMDLDEDSDSIRLINQLLWMNDHFQNYLEHLESQLQTIYLPIEKQQNRILYLNHYPQIKKDLYHFLQSLQSRLDRFIEAVMLWPKSDQINFQDKFKEILTMCHQGRKLIASLLDENSYIILKSHQVQERFYQFNVCSRDYQYINFHEDFLEPFHQVLLFSPGNAYFKQFIGSYHRLNLWNYAYYLLKQSEPALDVYLEMDYLPTRSTKTTDLTDDLKSVVDWMNDSSNFDRSVSQVLLVGSRQQAVEAYQYLTQHLDNSIEIPIFAQHISGSMNKIKRYIRESNTFVLVIQWQTLKDLDWPILDKTVQLHWIKLPFRSLEDPLIKLQADLASISKEEIFDQLLIADMCHNLLATCQTAKGIFSLDLILLFDGRVFSKYYSKEIQQRLDRSLHFILE